MRTSSFMVVPLLGLMILTSCSGGESAPDPAVSASRAEPLKVSAVRAEARTISRRVEIVGTLLTEDEVVVSSEVEGVIEHINADLGDFVNQGDLMAQIEPRDFRLRVDEAEAALNQVRAQLGLIEGQEQMAPEETTIMRQARAIYDEARLRFERIRRLEEEGVVSSDDLDRARSAFLVAEARYHAASEEVQTLLAQLEQRRAALAMARRELEKTVIRAPIAGGVTVRQVSAGERVKVNEPIITLVKLNPLRLRADVPELYASNMVVGRELSFTIDAFPQERFQGRISRISPSVNPETRSLTIEAEIDNRDRALKPGFFARAEVVIQPNTVVTMIPTSAVVSYVGLTKVFVVEEGRASERAVKLGTRSDGWVEVTEGVRPHDLVVTNNLDRLRDKQPVEAQ